MSQEVSTGLGNEAAFRGISLTIRAIGILVTQKSLKP